MCVAFEKPSDQEVGVGVDAVVTKLPDSDKTVVGAVHGGWAGSVCKGPGVTICF